MSKTGLTAIIMAGGKSSRMNSSEEKPLLKIAGKPMIEHVLNTLKNVKDVNRIVVATSPHTPKTAEAAKPSAEVVETPGEDYVSDTQFAVRKLKLGATLVVSADLPLLTSHLLEDVVHHFHRYKKPALAVMVPHETFRKFGLKPLGDLEVKGRRVSPVGVNVIEGRKIDEPEIDQEILILDQPELAVNVNTLQDLKTAERLIGERRRPEPVPEKSH